MKAEELSKNAILTTIPEYVHHEIGDSVMRLHETAGQDVFIMTESEARAFAK